MASSLLMQIWISKAVQSSRFNKAVGRYREGQENSIEIRFGFSYCSFAWFICRQNMNCHMDMNISQVMIYFIRDLSRASSLTVRRQTPYLRYRDIDRDICHFSHCDIKTKISILLQAL